MPKRHTILVIDDEAMVVKSVKNLLRLNYNVLGTTQASEALELLRREEVHVVMSDQRMPDTTGVELLNAIRGERPEVIRLLFTGYADIGAVIDAINKGNVYRYITKPWDPEELQAIVRDACAYFDLVAERKQLLEELRQKNAELSQSNELKGAFIKVASHEFRTPVTILRGLCMLARRDPEMAEPALQHLARIDGAGGRLERLVNQVLTLLAAEKFEYVLDRKLSEVKSVLKAAADDVSPFVELRHQVFHIDLADDLGSVDMDTEKIRDSLTHLLLNAIKFTHDGGRVEFEARRKADGIEIEVTDTGSGIAPESLSRMFQPFFTAFDVSTHSSGIYEHGVRGLGVGLSIVKAFVELHGGTVSVQSEVGKGSTFRVLLPQNTTQPAPGAANT